MGMFKLCLAAVVFLALFVAKSKSIILPQWIGSSVFENSALGKEFEKREATNTLPFLTCGFIPANPPTLPSECQDYLNITSSGDDLTTDEEDIDTLSNATSQFCTPSCIDPLVSYYRCLYINNYDVLRHLVRSIVEYVCGKESSSGDFCNVHYINHYNDSFSNRFSACVFTNVGINCTTGNSTCIQTVADFNTNMGCCTAPIIGDVGVATCGVSTQASCQSAINSTGAIVGQNCSLNLPSGCDAYPNVSSLIYNERYADFDTLNAISNQVCISKCIDPVISYYRCIGFHGKTLNNLVSLIEQFTCGREAISNDFCQVHYFRRYENDATFILRLVTACSYTTLSGINCTSANDRSTCLQMVADFNANMGCCTAPFIGDVGISTCGVSTQTPCQSATNNSTSTTNFAGAIASISSLLYTGIIQVFSICQLILRFLYIVLIYVNRVFS